MLRGLGMANPIEVAAGPFPKPRKDLAKIEVYADGTATLYAGSMSTGQGIETTLTDLVAGQLGLPREAIRYQAGDTDDLPDGRGNGGSGAMAVGGAATQRAVEKVIATGRALAAEMLDAKPDDIDFADGRFPLRGTNHSVGLADVARYADSKSPPGLSVTAEFMPPAVTYPNGCHMVEVEIDPETGVVGIARYAIVEDIGNVLNPKLAHGQIQGGVAMGVGQALGELITYDEQSGQLISGSFMDYQMPRADDVPSVRIETRAVGSLVATINAICDALSPLGIRHIEMPATPARVWAAIQDAKRANQSQQNQ
jgi:carbon-monoxide dehydrogenase large subunit